MKPFAILALAATALTLTACGENLGKGQPLNVVSGHIVMGATPTAPPWAISASRVGRSLSSSSR